MFGLYLLVVCSDRCRQTSSYYVCAMETYPRTALLIDFVILFSCLGGVRSFAECYRVSGSTTALMQCAARPSTGDRTYVRA